MPPWEKFRVGIPPLTGFNNSCRKFETVSHTCHVDAALNIFELGEIRPYLVFDKSILNDRRILVSWLSPNHWGVGFRYGNIKYDFEFKPLIANRKFYWVRAISYKIPAPRILVTVQNHDATLIPYDPTDKDGPWWHDTKSDEHYFNNNYCLEFMFEGSVSMNDLRTLQFVDHHSQYCSIHRDQPDKCVALGFAADRGGATFLARAAALGLSLVNLKANFVNEKGTPKNEFEFAVDKIRRLASRSVTFSGDVNIGSGNCDAVARAICSAVSFDQIEDSKRLASLFETEGEFDKAIAKVIARVVGLDDWGQLVTT